MASSYPGSADSFATIGPSDTTTTTVGGRTHKDMHNDLGDAIEAVQGELGTNPSDSETTVKARFEKIEDGTRLFQGTAWVTYSGSWPGSRPNVPADWIVVFDSFDTPSAAPPSIALERDAWIAAPTAAWGSSSPIDLLQASDFVAAGDILVATGSGTVARLPVGTTGQALVVDTAQTQKVKWSNATGTAATVTKTANYTATSDDHTIRIDTTSGNVTIALPTAASSVGRIYTFKKTVAANTATIDPSGAETIDGSSTSTLSSQYDKLTIQSNGTSWDII